jgi:hypothetical protein
VRALVVPGVGNDAGIGECREHLHQILVRDQKAFFIGGVRRPQRTAARVSHDIAPLRLLGLFRSLACLADDALCRMFVHFGMSRHGNRVFGERVFVDGVSATLTNEEHSELFDATNEVFAFQVAAVG